MPFASFEELLLTADCDQESDGTWTVHCNGRGAPGKLYNCVGNNPFEAIEDAWRWIEMTFEVLCE